VASARKIAKTVAESSLVKTAITGADPNWGRIAMAIGKCEDEPDIVPEKVAIGFGEISVYPDQVDPAEADLVSRFSPPAVCRM